MAVWLKQGVCGDLLPEAQKGFGRVAYFFKTHGEDMYVTAIRDGNHIHGSFHYIGSAFDIRYPKRRFTEVEWAEIENVLGTEWDIVRHSNHIHFERDPK